MIGCATDDICIILTKEELKRVISILDDVYHEYGCTAEEGKLVDKLKARVLSPSEEDGMGCGDMNNIEARIDAELAEIGVTAHITHLKQPEGCCYNHVTVATQKFEEYQDLRIALNTVYLEGSIRHKTGSALDQLIITRFAERSAGVSPCHALDNFSRKRGRIIAKGRLIKAVKA